MPSRSRAEHNFWEWVDHTPGAAEKAGVSKAVAHEFVQADKGKDTKHLPEHVRKKAAELLMKGK